MSAAATAEPAVTSPGVLVVTIQQARGLKLLVRRHRHDSYCVLRIGAQSFRTRFAVNSRRNPHWLETTQFTITGEPVLEVEVMQSSGDLGPDILIARATVPLSSIRLTPGIQRLQAPLRTRRRSGREHQLGFLCLTLSWTPQAAPDAAPAAPPVTGYPVALPLPLLPLPPPPPMPAKDDSNISRHYPTIPPIGDLAACLGFAAAPRPGAAPLYPPCPILTEGVHVTGGSGRCAATGHYPVIGSLPVAVESQPDCRAAPIAGASGEGLARPALLPVRAAMRAKQIVGRLAGRLRARRARKQAAGANQSPSVIAPNQNGAARQ